MEDGVPRAGVEGSEDLVFSGSEETWQRLLAGPPERFYNDLMANLSTRSGLRRSGDAVAHAQYFSAIMRSVELLRQPFTANAPLSSDPAPAGTVSAATGRYIHLDLDGASHRIYFEEAGHGIPVLLQHTAGCHSSQWRHLLEDARLTERFRLIAYDLPYHGKSLPPVGVPWWEQRYLLKGDFLRAVPLQLAAHLKLDQPVFMGCSVGGLLALDLAHKHPDQFRAVISVEGALKIEGSLAAMDALWHPQISSDYKARLMEGLVAPMSPTAYRKETAFVYSSGWPQSFQGDLHYYVEEYDLRSVAHEIDTDRVSVDILSGEYDYSGTRDHGRAAHEAIAGSTWQEMPGMGHFPMSENPELFIPYLLPILDRIATR
ncbi:MAG: alpha/beta fold hydrolase [Pseudomonadales bacterium]